MKRALRRTLVGVLGLVLGMTASAYLANNLVAPSQAGEGHVTVTVTTTSSTGQPIVDAPSFPAT